MNLKDQDLGRACPNCNALYTEHAPIRLAKGFKLAEFMNQIVKCSNCRWLHSWNEEAVSKYKDNVEVDEESVKV